MTSLADFLMRNKLDALGEKPEYTTADVNELMPKQPSWSSPLAGLGSYQLSQEAGAEPNWFGRNVLSNIPPEAMHAANFLIPGKVPRIPNPIKAYHGSPHDFDKFDLSKIGTGEGAQAYGHGLYFAEKPSVAESYKNVLGGREFTVGDKQLYTSSGNASKVLDTQSRGQTIAADALDDAFNAQSTSPAQFAANRLRQQRRLYPEEAQHIDEALKVIGDWQESGGMQKLQGKMYEVALHATQEQFLDWDKPLSGQTKAVRDVLPMDVWNKVHFPGRGGTGYDAAAGQALSEAGIPGVRYLDQGSRSTLARPELVTNPDGSQQWATRNANGVLRRFSSKEAAEKFWQDAESRGRTSNYVVWSPELIEILRKYAAPPAIAAPALASILQDQQSQ